MISKEARLSDSPNGKNAKHLAMKVKVNDLKDNMTMGRLKTIGKHDLRRMAK